MENLKKLSLVVILDAYATKNAIEHFLSQDHNEFLAAISINYKEDVFNKKLYNYLEYVIQELNEINEFLDDTDNLYLTILGYKREFFDKNLPKHKRKIEWFRSIDRYPFDYSMFIPEL